MTADQVKWSLEAIPFRRFELCLADGRVLPVEHPELLALENGNRIVVLGTSDGAVEIIDLMLVRTLRFHQPDYVHGSRSGKTTSPKNL